MNVYIGNIVALLASVLMIFTGLINNKKKVLIIQSIQMSLFILSNLILGGISGAIINAINIVRNYICYKDKLDNKWKIIFSLVAIINVVLFNNLKIIGLLPLISTLTYVWLMSTKDMRKFKLLMMFSMLLWFIYDITIKSYTSSIFDLLTFISSFITLIKLKKVVKK